ncbi:polyribonucleotide nucleotidyltransferase [Candidatus Kaiserbacteria bacterium]|nr:polyribonucleotide nucleotidyltransferase [Candidatus Kaiserbacteria bacterium]
MKKEIFEVELGGKKITAEFSDLASQANGSVLLKMGDTTILVTAVMSNKENNAPYFPLSVEFEEKFYAAGAILGSRFIRREGRPSDEAILSARIIDRTIRPLFDNRIRRDIQIVVSVLAIGEEDPDVLGVIGASLALSVSNIPWAGPVGAVRIGQKRETGEIIINPNYEDREKGKLTFEVLACGKDGHINMIETASEEVSEDDIIAVLEASSKAHAVLEKFQKEIVNKIGQTKKEFTFPDVPSEVSDLWHKNFAEQLTDVLFSGQTGKSHIHEFKEKFIEAVNEATLECSTALLDAFFEEAVDKELHRGALEENKRADGRDMDTIRPLYAQAGGVSPMLHGSGIFYRGETHIFTALTLGGPESAQLVDTIETPELKKRYMHHYNFPPFSVGESGRVGGFNRRMIGHGALAEKALVPVIPNQDEFPYTIRLVSETMSSNGSSSMASVCGSTLALMDGGVPIKTPVAGIASGLIMGEDKYILLTDIQGPEDEHGDMDFKVAGTKNGITAIQMDVKVSGIPIPILKEALEKARQARLKIITVMETEIAKPRPEISPRAPEIKLIKILPEQIGLVIGSGGKTINNIKETSGVEEISIEDDGTVFITGKNGTCAIAAESILALTKVYETGDRVNATITKVTDFGAFAKLDEHNEGLIHVSEIASFRVESVKDYLKEGQTVPVIVSKIDNGKIGLSIKQADDKFITEK